MNHFVKCKRYEMVNWGKAWKRRQKDGWHGSLEVVTLKSPPLNFSPWRSFRGPSRPLGMPFGGFEEKQKQNTNMCNTDRCRQLYPHPHTVSAILPNLHTKVQVKQYQLILQSQLAIKNYTHNSSKWLPYQKCKIPAQSSLLNLTIQWF